ncbi:hypothetical protein Purlil1_3899 [Purpureocillium lilacinum]|uniref:Uncharacterized protein n=1 Tax=Purpureocillium lilacinum TaxID=33203 RepID=A0ABR0C529_PURLI|nr:hypothetical protein Purlil1_3899 [Purpureocillium lilacinum]
MPRQREDEGEQQTQHPPRTKKKERQHMFLAADTGKASDEPGERAGSTEKIFTSRVEQLTTRDAPNKRGAAQQQCSAARALKENREMEEKAQRGSWSPAAGQSWDGDKMLLRRFLGGAPDGARARDFGSMSSWAGGHGAVPRFQVPSELSRVESGSCSQQFVSRRLAAWHGLGMGMDEPAIHYLTSGDASICCHDALRCTARPSAGAGQPSPRRAPRRRATLLHDDGRSSKRVHDSSMLRRDGRHPPAQFEPWGCCHAAPQGTTLILNPPSPPDPGAKACLACWRLFQARANSARRPGHAPRNKPPQSGGSNTGVGYGQRIVPRVKYTRRCVERQLQHVAPQVRADHQFGGPADATTEHRITMTPAAKTGFCRCVRAPPACRQFHQARAPRSPFVPPAASNSDLASGRLREEVKRGGSNMPPANSDRQGGTGQQERRQGNPTMPPRRCCGGRACVAWQPRQPVVEGHTHALKRPKRRRAPGFYVLVRPGAPPVSLAHTSGPPSRVRPAGAPWHTHTLTALCCTCCTRHTSLPSTWCYSADQAQNIPSREGRFSTHREPSPPRPPPGPPCPPTAVVAVADQPWLPADGEGEGARDAQRRVTGWGR